MKFVAMLCGMILLVSTAAAWADGQPGIDMGKRLFGDTHLGESRNDQSCASCHANGAKLEHASQNPDLTGQINRCIAGPLGGKPLDPKSAAMRSLVMYVESVSKKGK